MIFRNSLKNILIIVLLLLGESWCQSSKCVLSPSSTGLSSSYDIISNFQSGTVNLQNRQKGSRYNYYNISLSNRMNSTYDIALSIQNIFSFTPSEGLDFFINANKLPTLISAVFAIDSKATWSSVQIYYLVSGRKDFSVGIFLANNAGLIYSTGKSSALSIRHHVANAPNATSDYLYSLPFISGIRTFETNLNFSFTSSHFNHTIRALDVDVFIGSSKFPIETLYISYFIFNIASDLEVTSLSGLSYLPTNVNAFIGVSDINPFANIVPKAAANTTTPKPLLGATEKSKQTFGMIFGLSGIIIQTQQSMDLLFRSLTPASKVLQTIYCISKRKCNSLSGTMVYEQQTIFNITSKCVICMSYAYYNQTLNACQCIEGYIENNGSCIEQSKACGDNATYNHTLKLCVCNTLYVKISNKCVSVLNICQAGTIYFQGKCIRIVYPDAATAKCSSDSLFINKTCVKKIVCQPPASINLTDNTCSCPGNHASVNGSCVECSINETLINNVCKCNQSYFRIEGKCLTCSKNGYFDGRKCVCMKFFTGDGFNCRASENSAKLSMSAPSGLFSKSVGGTINLN